jgi:hypothetical protein
MGTWIKEQRTYRFQDLFLSHQKKKDLRLSVASALMAKEFS